MKRLEGVTLVEIMLVLVIGAMLFYMGMRQYYSYKQDADIYQIQSNVNTIFRGMANFYRAECYGNVDPNTAQPLPGTGRLRNSNPPNPFPIDVEKDLVKGGYLYDKDLPLTSLIDTTVGDNGYLAQFNGYTKTNSTGTVILWRAQIAVKVRDPSQNTLYLTLLEGDCLSKMSGSAVSPCPGDPTGSYIVWERIPSLAGAKIDTTQPTWVSIPSVQQFTNMYRNFGDDYLLSTSHSPEMQYYYCGGS